MFLFRALFWLTLVVLLIPADPQAGGDAPSVGMFQALGAAKAAFSDASLFCERNRDACETGSSTVKLLELKARNGVRMLQKYFTDEDSTQGKGTLSTKDLSHPWQGSSATSGSV